MENWGVLVCVICATCPFSVAFWKPERGAGLLLHIEAPSWKAPRPAVHSPAHFGRAGGVSGPTEPGTGEWLPAFWSPSSSHMGERGGWGCDWQLGSLEIALSVLSCPYLQYLIYFTPACVRIRVCGTHVAEERWALLGWVCLSQCHTDGFWDPSVPFLRLGHKHLRVYLLLKGAAPSPPG